MKKHLILYTTFLGFFSILVLSAFNLPQDKKEGAAWDIPEKYQKMENTFKGDEGLVKVGKTIYMKHCRSCHGNTGLGDGPKAARLETAIRSLASEEFQAQSDGVIYYQSIIGRDEMPNFESKIPDDEDRWAVVMYMRTLK